jgi:predicted hydrocarbon binding protein
MDEIIEKPNRILPPIMVKGFLHGLAEELGVDKFHLLLKQLGLLHYAILLESSRIIEMRASDWALLQRTVRQETGKDANQILNRAGKLTWNWIAREATFTRQVELKQAGSHPSEIRRIKTLHFLVAQMRQSDTSIRVYSLGDDLIYEDTLSDTTWGIEDSQFETQPICYTTQGIINAALDSIIGSKHDVQEINCRATGNFSCQFRIRGEA